MMRLYWRVVNPITLGVKLLLIKEKKILLVKHTYQNHWFLPGGGVKKGETLESAARREVFEEVGGELDQPQLFGVYSGFSHQKSDHVVVFLCEDFSLPDTEKVITRSWEIEKVDFFDLDNLPQDASPGTRRRVAEYMNGKDLGGFGEW